MFQLPDVMRDAQALARHSGAAQTQSAKNMANADTPGFRGKELVPFSEVMTRSVGEIALRRSRADHMSGGRETVFHLRATGDAVDLNGNDVSIEAEMVRAARAQSQHTTAMTVYKASLDMMRTALGRGR